MLTSEKVGEIERAKARVLDGYEALWNERLGLLVKSGDLAALLNHLRSPVELAGDNCSCNSGCGSLEMFGGVNPVSRVGL